MALFNSSIGRKIVMSLSGLFLITFLVLHLFVNFSAVFSADTYNTWSQFMGYNYIVQFILQPLLIAGIIIHFVMGMVLENRNRKARKIKYRSYNKNSNTNWASRNMLFSGAVVLVFFAIHFYDFWTPEMTYKFIDKSPHNVERFYPHLLSKFADPWRTAFYCIAFVMLALHLWHGFYSSFQSIGWNNKYSRALRGFTRGFAIVIPAGFIFLALYFHFIQ